MMKRTSILCVIGSATLGSATLGACSREPAGPAGDEPMPQEARGTLRGSVLLADAGLTGMSNVVIGFRSADDYVLVSTRPDGSFLADGLPTIEWRAELQLPADHHLAPGETGTRVAIVQPERTISLLPFRVRTGVPDTFPPAPRR
ncbi:hypothetical protein BH23GEM9_BH23GEM9_16320 [soil metagenome]